MAGLGRRRKGDTDEKKVKLTKESYRKAKRLFSYLKPYTGLVLIGLIALLLTTSASLIFPQLTGDLVNEAGGPTDRSALIEQFVKNTDESAINQIALILLVVFFLQSVFSFFRVYIFHYVAEKVLTKLRQDTYAHVLRQPMDFFNRNRVGDLNSRISADVTTLHSVLTVTIAEFLRQVLIIVASVTILMFQSPKLTSLMLATLPVVAIIGVFFGRFIKKLSKKRQDILADSNVIIEETFSAITVVKAFASELFEIKRYNKITEEARRISMKAAVGRGFFISFILFAVFGAIVFIIWSGIHMVKNNPDFEVGHLVAFIMYSVFIGAAAGSLPDMWASIQKGIGATEHLMGILEEQPEHHAQTDEEAAIRHKISGNVSFDNVSFSYPSRKDVPVLKHLSFDTQSGQQVAIVGPSGAGKSTLISLLLRFYEPESGTILFDGKPAGEYSLSELRQQIGLVPQEVLLFGGSIRENIAYANPQASEEEIIAAAKKANAHEFIEGFPEGYDTVVGERGIQLSGGQRQRVAIARAVLKDPAVLILDEATSSLDSESERLVQGALDKLMEGRTSFVIAHRLSTIRKASTILVIENGELKETGTHDDLMAQEDGLYKHLSELQWEGQQIS